MERAAQVDPDIQLTYWGGRSYSAEFYTRGRAKAISDHEGLRMLGLNDVRDAVAVGPDALDQVTEVLGDQFESLGKFGRNVLLVEAVAAGEKP